MKQNLVIITSFSIFMGFLGLLGCENDRNSDVICKNNSEICADLHQDSWCRFEKTNLIRHRLQLKQTETPSGQQLYQQLLHLENYSNCVELAAGVQHILNPQRTQDRVRAYAVSTQTLSELRDYTNDNPDIYLAYYRWIRFNDKPSQDIVIKHYQDGTIDDPEILSQLAAYYVRVSPPDAKRIYRYLFTSVNAEQFNPDWLLGLASIFQQQQNFEYVYLFTKANSLMTDNQVDQKQLNGLINSNTELATVLDTQAQVLISDIQSPNFANSISAQLLEDK
ncbi:DUF2989 domain-containing protein [Shewanella sp. OMA3-2]|uniref:DUF2989 domain-containing protein n=1 Tax=Shewanella sp. OMA3-2 TaxID=2908650 RepID=UPI001F191BA9|nr:DUF2989 domain-containing protein [Shewanella sp. OMA3-2]UJF20776.1 DUF2989 domain-containing protein [Shewanella sp. OMA3-2]